MRRKRRKVTWFPILGTRSDNAGVLNQTTSKLGDIILPQDGTFSGSVIPLLFDQPSSNLHDDPANKTISDFVGSEYILRRVVGKLFVNYLSHNAASESAGDGARGAMVTAGLFVARADASEVLPIGFTSLADFANYDSDDPENSMEPWIWRRKWILGSPGYTEVDGTVADESFPATNAGYGSMADGPHLDARTGRRVGQDDRLWFSITVRPLPYAQAYTGNSDGVGFNLDIRALGTLTKGHNKSSF